MYVLGGQLTLAHPCLGIHRRTSLMSLSLLLHQCPACLLRLTWVVCEMGEKWLYSCCFVLYCFQDSFKVARTVLVYFPSSFFCVHFVIVHVVYPSSHINTATAWKKSGFISSGRSDFHKIDIYIYTHKHIYIYIYIKREREREHVVLS